VNSGAVFYLVPPDDRTQKWEAIKLHHEPTVHRMRWVKNADGKFDLVVVPLHGRGNNAKAEGVGAKILAYKVPADPKQPWKTELLDEIRSVIKNRASYGYRRTTAIIRRQRRAAGLRSANHKRVYRIMRENGLLLSRHFDARPGRLHEGKVVTLQSNLRWCSDCFEARTLNGERIQVAFVLDCCDREVMSYVAEKRPLFHGDIIRLIDQTVTHRFGEFAEKLPHTIQWLTDQGPQYKAIETVAYGTAWGFDVRTTPAYSPESNGMAEGFVKLFKRDYVYVNEIWTAESVLRRLPEWFADYNRSHPHSGLQMRSPLKYREAVQSTEEVSV
jgi:transposase InsO family protein